MADRLTASVDSEKLRGLLRDHREIVLVLFSGEWCPDCRAFGPTWDRWISGRSMAVYVMDVPRGGREWEDWHLDEIPTVRAFWHETELASIHGTVITTADLDRLLAESREVVKTRQAQVAKGKMNKA